MLRTTKFMAAGSALALAVSSRLATAATAKRWRRVLSGLREALHTVCGPAFHDTGNVAFEGHVRIKLAPLSAEGGGKFAGKFSSAALPIYSVPLSLSVNPCLQRGNMARSCCCCSVAAAAAAVAAAAAAQSARPSRFDPLLQLQRLMPSLCIVPLA